MGRFSRSWDLFKTSFGVIKQDKELLWLPVLSFIATAIAIMGIAGVGWVSGIIPDFVSSEGQIDAPGAILAFLFYLAVAFVQVFFFAATVAGANERLSGGDPTLGSALGAAGKRIGVLFLWSIVVATVNVIMQALRSLARNSDNAMGQILGSIAVSLVGAAWNLATYFVVPILMFENKGVGGGLKGSAGYFKKTWGEQIIGEVGIGFAAFVVNAIIVVAGIALVIGGFMLGGMVLGLMALALLVIALVLSAIVFTVAGAVYRTALYRFASQGQPGGPFAAQELAVAWRPVR